MPEKINIDELRSLELSIAIKVRDFCEENNIVYFLAYGSLIGAIRHKGFIPWDDDIDIVMMRPDYEKFCHLFPQYEEEYNLKLVNSHTKPYYGRPMTKVIDAKTVLYEPMYIGDDPIGVFIDIWPLDGVPSQQLKQKIHLSVNYLLNRMYMCRIRSINSLHGVEKILHLLTLPFPRKSLLALIEYLNKMYKIDGAEEVICYSVQYKKTLKKEYFLKRKAAYFENFKFAIPWEYDQILKTLYGNYMKLPPKEMQKTHHMMNIYWNKNIDSNSR